jgi:excisionase family DNA binding protein
VEDAVCDELLLKVPEVARRLGLGRSFVYQRLLQSGALPSVKVAGARRVLASDLEEFVRGLRAMNEEG